MRNLLGALVASALLLAIAAVPVGAATLTKCKSVNTPTGSSSPVYESGTTCTTARAVASKYANTGKREKGWICKGFGYEGGVSISCHKGTGVAQKRVRFQLAD